MNTADLDYAIYYFPTDNESATKNMKNNLCDTKTRHLAVKYGFIKEHYDNGELMIEWIPTSKQIADIFTKPLPNKLFHEFRSMLMGEC